MRKAPFLLNIWIQFLY